MTPLKKREKSKYGISKTKQEGFFLRKQKGFQVLLHTWKHNNNHDNHVLGIIVPCRSVKLKAVSNIQRNTVIHVNFTDLLCKVTILIKGNFFI